ncbi:hypothetical protein RvY_04796 [Ramazzottius varieornatus]|uniref:Uncharacterized protein n=1 Tax=Ramazzottius varieornatus TaxID=947166 RepID=A0A1D1V200_RAMVA|nr:hypothetical protein RvY_04796 [Ramazzottius varieornatus]
MIILHHFGGLMSPESEKLTAPLQEVMCDLRELEQFTSSTTAKVNHHPNLRSLAASEVTIAEEARKLCTLIQLYQNYQAGSSIHYNSFISKLRLPSQQLDELRKVALIKEKATQ